MQKCKFCEEVIEEGDQVFYTVDGDPVCVPCYENDTQYCSKVFCFGCNDPEPVLFTEYFNHSEPGEALPTPIKKQKWVSTDAWRGYTDWELKDGFVKYSDGWITSYPDDTTKRKAELGEYFEDIKEGKITPPVPIYWIFGHTSNVFSQASTIVVAKKDKKKLIDWIEKINGTSEEFKNRFK